MRLNLLHFGFRELCLTFGKQFAHQLIKHVHNDGGQFLCLDTQKRAQQRVAFGIGIRTNIACVMFANHGSPLAQAIGGHRSPVEERGRGLSNRD